MDRRRGTRPYGAGGRGETEAMSRREKRLLLRLSVSAVILLAVVLAKLLLPGMVFSLRERLSGPLNASMDVREVFSAVGKAVSGGEDAAAHWREAYRAVFNPESEAVETAADGVTAAAAALSGAVYDTSALPENVCLTQAVLGFAYASPLAGTLTSSFGFRAHPVGGEEEFHHGVDLAAEEGTAISCFADGVVRITGESTSLGKYLMVDHANGYTTLYAHCSSLTARAEQTVRRGESVAAVGQTGDATGAHLHFELHRGSEYLNPIYYV